MERVDLEALGREDLVVRARRAGVGRAELLTRVELVDEIVKRSVTEPEKRARARGLLGRARDLLATVIERGLHLPDAAARVRSFPAAPLPVQPEPVATVTLAEIYAAQGHAARALAVLDEVLAAEPDHEAARALRSRLAERASSAVPVTAPEEADEKPAPAPSASRVVAAQPPPVPSRPIPMLDDAPLPDAYGVDEAVVMPVDPTTAYVYWEVRPATVARARAHATTGRLVVHVEAEVDGRVAHREIEAERAAGDYFLFGLPEGAELRASLSWVTGTASEPLAKSRAVATGERTAAARVADSVVFWSPARTRAPAPAAPPAGVALAVAIARALDDEPTAPIAPGPVATANPHIPLGSSGLFSPPSSPRSLGSSENLRR